IHHADNIINIAGQLQQDWALNVQLTVPALEQTVAGANGAVQGKFSLSGPRNHPRLEGNVQANSLRYQQYELAELALDTKLWLSRDNTLNTELELTARDGRAAHQQLEQLTLSLSGNERQHQLSAAVISAEQQIELKLSGALSDDRQQWQGQLQQAEFGSLFGPWQLADVASIRYSRPQNQLQLSAHCWQQQASNLCLTKPLIVSQQQASAALQLKQFNLATLAPLLPLRTGLTGQADATLSVNWQRGTQPEASLTLQSDGGQLTQQLDTPLQLDWQYLRLNNTLSDDNLHSTLQLNFVEQATLNADIQIANLQQGDRQLSGTVQLEQLAMQVLQPLIGEFSELQGQLSSNVQVSGQLASPELKGDLTLEQLRIKGKTAPLDVDDAKIVLNFAGQQAQLNGLVKTPQGEINLSGDASWQQLADWQATLKITGDELRLQVPQARLQVAPDLTLSATPKLTQLRGTVTIPVATITIDSLSDDAVELSDDLVLLNAQLEPVAQEDKSLFRFKTDIKVVLGNKVKLSAFGLKTRLSGNLRVRQQPRQVLRLNGDVSLQDGTFRAYGQDLLIRKGKMNFNGPADQPFLNIEAIRNPDNMEDDVIAGIRVTGPADAPNVVIFSEPAKP
ncbi:MAG: translocation/assembly module TamB domain-containing protein, partial [Rheinheimera sp.]|nr:translocation/assembly module TamB domain-containing protein [Rheinheimera sp.]